MTICFYKAMFSYMRVSVKGISQKHAKKHMGELLF